MWAGARAGVGQAYCTKSEAQSQASASASASADDGVCTCCASSALSSESFSGIPVSSCSRAAVSEQPELTSMAGAGLWCGQ